MAEKIKSIKKNSKAADALKQEKEETVEVKQLLKDERTQKIAGSICLLLAVLLFVAFTSYLFTWEDDQDKVFSEGIHLLFGTTSKLSNLMGSFGAYISHLFIFKGFGIAAYLLCSLFFILGINLFFGKKVFSVIKNIKYLLLGLPLLSVTASVIMNGNNFAWGGAVGDMCRDFFYGIVGQIGTIGILLVAFLAYVIWRFNPSFKMPTKEAILPTKEEDNLQANTIEKDELENEDDVEEKSIVSSGNTLSGNALVLNVPDQSPKFDHELTINERADEEEKRGARIVDTFIVPPKKTGGIFEENKIDEPAIEETFVAVQAPKKQTVLPDLTLEVKTVTEDAIEEAPKKTAADVNALSPYDPILDLRDYKYPTVDLLESHGSEKIVQDPQELENNKNQIISTLIMILIYKKYQQR
jgi:DNA segregation ATPase FtsK/SpoIIIE, S-DNA-T family